MKGRIVAMASICVAWTSPAAEAGSCQVPVNEECAGLIPLDNADLPYSELGILGCTNDVADKPYYDLFYRFDCTVSGSYTLDMCGSVRDTYIRIYTGACGWSGGAEFAVADDECAGSPPSADPRLTVPFEAGTPYWIEIGSWRPELPWGEPNSDFIFNIVLEPSACAGDFDGSGSVGFGDLLTVLTAWGPCPVGPGCPEDLDGSGDVGYGDLLEVLTAWGPCR